MSPPDLVNGLFEVFAGAFIWLSVRKVLKDKQVHGISWIHVGFFSLWGLWNLFFYAHLNQMLSWFGGFFVTIMNLWYTGLLVYYSRRRT